MDYRKFDFDIQLIACINACINGCSWKDNKVTSTEMRQSRPELCWGQLGDIFQTYADSPMPRLIISYHVDHALHQVAHLDSLEHHITWCIARTTQTHFYYSARDTYACTCRFREMCLWQSLDDLFKYWTMRGHLISSTSFKENSH